MERIKYEEFIALFSGLHSAIRIMKGNTTKENRCRLLDAYNRLAPLQSIPRRSTLFADVIGEIGNNLYSLSEQNRRIYVEQLVRYWVDIVPYFDYNTCYDHEESLNLRTPCIPYAKYTLELLHDYNIGNRKWKDMTTVAERYVIMCKQEIYSFATNLDLKCAEFGLDFQKIQDSLGVWLQRTRDQSVFHQRAVSIPKHNNNKETTLSVEHENTPDNKHYPDLVLFGNYFTGDRSGWWDNLTTDIESCLKTGRGGYTTVAIAKVIYDSGKLHHAMRPISFASWLKVFCEAWNIVHIPTSKPSNNGVKAEIDRMSAVFYYFK